MEAAERVSEGIAAAVGQVGCEKLVALLLL